MKPKRRRRSIKRKYKGLVAAVAGAAVLSSSLLPGLPVTTAHAAAIPGTGATEVSAQAETNAVAASPVDMVQQHAREYGFDAARDNFSLEWRGDHEAMVLVTSDDGAQYKVRLVKGKGNDWTIRSVRETERNHASQNIGDPVRVVKDNAARFGFDADSDNFSLLSISGVKALVQVRTGGRIFKVDLVRKDGQWEITTIRGIGNMKYPATYTPASMFYYSPATESLTTAPATDQVIYRTDNYAGWSWQETAYPRDISFGIVLSASQVIGSVIYIPEHVRDQIKNVDLDRQFVLFASLGTVASKGYGIGIERIVQNGNNLTVTVAANSPQSGAKLSQTKVDDYLLIDRSAVDFTAPINIVFIDRNGTPLSNFTILPQ